MKLLVAVIFCLAIILFGFSVKMFVKLFVGNEWYRHD